MLKFVILTWLSFLGVVYGYNSIEQRRKTNEGSLLQAAEACKPKYEGKCLMDILREHSGRSPEDIDTLLREGARLFFTPAQSKLQEQVQGGIAIPATLLHKVRARS